MDTTYRCPSPEVFWSSTQFRVSTGHGGGVAAKGVNHLTIRDSDFQNNEAPRGATLSMASTLTARITTPPSTRRRISGPAQFRRSEQLLIPALAIRAPLAASAHSDRTPPCAKCVGRMKSAQTERHVPPVRRARSQTAPGYSAHRVSTAASESVYSVQPASPAPRTRQAAFHAGGNSTLRRGGPLRAVSARNTELGRGGVRDLPSRSKPDRSPRRVYRMRGWQAQRRWYRMHDMPCRESAIHADDCVRQLHGLGPEHVLV